jgi:hypothetical protein
MHGIGKLVSALLSSTFRILRIPVLSSALATQAVQFSMGGFEKEEIEHFQRILSQYVDGCVIRG